MHSANSHSILSRIGKQNDAEASDTHNNNYGKLGTQSKSYLRGGGGGGGGGGGDRETDREGWVGRGKVNGIAGTTGVACENTYGHCASYINVRTFLN